jgi:hypothetical protein
MRYLLVPLAAASAFLLVAQGPAWAVQNGFGSTTTTTKTQGNSGKPANPNASPNNQGTATTTTTTTGPKGQLKQGNTSCNNCTTSPPTTSGPGKSK